MQISILHGGTLFLTSLTYLFSASSMRISQKGDERKGVQAFLNSLPLYLCCWV